MFCFASLKWFERINEWAHFLSYFSPMTWKSWCAFSRSRLMAHISFFLQQSLSVFLLLLFLQFDSYLFLCIIRCNTFSAQWFLTWYANSKAISLLYFCSFSFCLGFFVFTFFFVVWNNNHKNYLVPMCHTVDKYFLNRYTMWKRWKKLQWIMIEYIIRSYVHKQLLMILLKTDNRTARWWWFPFLLSLLLYTYHLTAIKW